MFINKLDRTIAFVVTVGLTSACTSPEPTDSQVPFDTSIDVDTGIPSGDRWDSVAAGFSVCATSGEALWCWGWNIDGEVGDGSLIDQAEPARIAHSTRWRNVLPKSGGAACALDVENELYCWGPNRAGQLGTGEPEVGIREEVTSGSVPTRVATAGPWADASLDYLHGCGVKASGALYCWGLDYPPPLELDDRGRLGSVPVPLHEEVRLKSVSSSLTHGCGITIDDKLLCWGGNSKGQLGNGSTLASSSPVEVAGGGTWATIDVDFWRSCGVRMDGTLWCWGENYIAGTQSSTPVQVGTASNWTWVEVYDDAACALDDAQTAWCWGAFGSPSVGPDHYFFDVVPEPTPVAFDGKVAALSLGSGGACLLTPRGRLFCTGEGHLRGKGELGSSAAFEEIVVPSE